MPGKALRADRVTVRQSVCGIQGSGDSTNYAHTRASTCSMLQGLVLASANEEEAITKAGIIGVLLIMMAIM